VKRITARTSTAVFLGEARFPDKRVRCHVRRRLRDLSLRVVLDKGRVSPLRQTRSLPIMPFDQEMAWSREAHLELPTGGASIAKVPGSSILPLSSRTLSPSSHPFLSPKPMPERPLAPTPREASTARVRTVLWAGSTNGSCNAARAPPSAF
jgi:hypothetical protein